MRDEHAERQVDDELGAPRFKPTVAQLGIDLAAQAWQRSGTGDGSLEVAFVRTAGRPRDRTGAPDAAGAATAGDLAAGAATAGDLAAVASAAGASAAEELWVLLRVAGDPAERVLVYDRIEWECFLDGVSHGEFDDAE